MTGLLIAILCILPVVLIVLLAIFSVLSDIAKEMVSARRNTRNGYRKTAL